MVVFEAATGRLLHEFPANDNTTITLSADGSRVVTIGPKGERGAKIEVGAWDTATGLHDNTLADRLADYSAANYSPDGRLLAALCRQTENNRQKVVFLDPSTLKEVGYVSGGAPLQFSPRCNFCCDYLGKHLRVWTVPGGKLVADIDSKQQQLIDSVFLDEDRIITTARDQTVRIWSVRSGQELVCLDKADPWPVAVSPDGKTISCGRLTLQQFDCFTGQPRVNQSVVGGLLSFSSSGKLLAATPSKSATEFDQPITLFDWQTRDSRVFGQYTRLICGLGFGKTDTVLVSLGNERNLRGWDTRSGKELWSLDDVSFGASFASAPSKGLVAVGTNKRAVEIYEAETGKNLQTLAGPKIPQSFKFHSVVFSADATLLAAVPMIFPRGSPTAQRLHVWDLGAGKLVADFTASQDADTVVLPAIAFSKDGKLLAGIGASNKGLFPWDVATGKESVLIANAHRVNALAISPDGKTLAAGIQTGKVTLWDMNKGKELESFEGHRGGVQALSWTPDGKVLASSSNDGSILLWDITGKAPPSPSQQSRLLPNSVLHFCEKRGTPSPDPRPKPLTKPSSRSIPSALRPWPSSRSACVPPPPRLPRS